MDPPSPSQRRSAFGSALKLLWILLLLSSCREPPPDCDSVRKLFRGREVQPRLTGFKFSGCISTDEIIPRASCRSEYEEGDLNAAAKLLKNLRNAKSSDSTPELTHAEALLELVTSAENSGVVLRAAANLREAASDESNPKRRAEILSDLAAVHLILGELFQSHLEIAASVEYSLAALENDPSLPEAKFNLTLGSLALGIEKPDDPLADPWLGELQKRWAPRESSFPAFKKSELQQSFDKWAKNPGTSIDIDSSLISESPDRFWADLQRQSELDPSATRQAWLKYRAAESASRNFDSKANLDLLKPAPRQNWPLPLELEIGYLRALTEYQRNHHDKCGTLLANLILTAEKQGYLELAVRAHRLAALALQVKGDYGSPVRHLDRASELARKSKDRQLEGVVRSLMVEQFELSGSEEEAWASVSQALRILDPNAPYPRILCFHASARLAMQRGFHRLALHAHQKSVSIGRELGGVPFVVVLRSRAERLAAIGHPEEALLDLQAARATMEATETNPELRDTLQADIFYLESLTERTAALRRASAEKAIGRFQNQSYGRRLVEARFSLAQSLIDLGRPDEARVALQNALDGLAHTTRTVDWVKASALVEAARPIVDRLIGLQLAQGREEDLLRTIGTYLGLRAATDYRSFQSSASQRLTYFVREQECVVVLENSSGSFVHRSQIGRRHLGQLRERLLLLIQGKASEPFLRKTTEELAANLLHPLADKMRLDEDLSIVADDVLSGIPFILLPFHDGLLIDTFAVAYSSDLRPHPQKLSWGREPLIVSSTTVEGNLQRLAEVEREAVSVASIYPSASLLEGKEATAEGLIRALGGHPDVLHLAGHFVVNSRSPLNSYFLLANTKMDVPSRFLLKDLLSPKRAQLIYLSGCDTGRGLPPTASGLHSLAQAITTPRSIQAILSLWRLDDEIGAQVAPSFHRYLNRGLRPATALRKAQLEHREKDAWRWASLALFY